MGKVDQSTTRCRLFASRAGKKEITRVQDSRSVKAEIGDRRILVVSERSLVWIDWKVQLQKGKSIIMTLKNNIAFQ